MMSLLLRCDLSQFYEVPSFDLASALAELADDFLLGRRASVVAYSKAQIFRIVFYGI